MYETPRCENIQTIQSIAQTPVIDSEIARVVRRLKARLPRLRFNRTSGPTNRPALPQHAKNARQKAKPDQREQEQCRR